MRSESSKQFCSLHNFATSQQTSLPFFAVRETVSQISIIYNIGNHCLPSPFRHHRCHNKALASQIEWHQCQRLASCANNDLDTACKTFISNFLMPAPIVAWSNLFSVLNMMYQGRWTTTRTTTENNAKRIATQIASCSWNVLPTHYFIVRVQKFYNKVKMTYTCTKKKSKKVVNKRNRQINLDLPLVHPFSLFIYRVMLVTEQVLIIFTIHAFASGIVICICNVQMR